MIMKQCAIVRNGTDIVKVTNLKRKYKKIQENPDMEILEECDKSEVDALYEKYKSENTSEEYVNNVDNNFEYKSYWWKRDTGEWICSIYTESEMMLIHLTDHLLDAYEPVTKEFYEEHCKAKSGAVSK